MRSFGSSACTLWASEERAVTAHSMRHADSPVLMHTTTPDAAQAFADSVAGMLPSGARPSIDGLGPAFVVHVGPGAMAWRRFSRGRGRCKYWPKHSTFA